MTDAVYADRVDALEQTWLAWGQLGRSMDQAKWSAATRCRGWDVACVYAHHSQFLLALTAPPPPAPGPAGSGRPQTAAEALRAFNEPGGFATSVGPDVAEQAIQEASGTDPDDLVERFTALGPAIIRRLRTIDPGLIVPWPGVPSGITLTEALRIVLMEATVHLLDVQRALGQPPALPAGALAQTAVLLAEVAPAIELIEAATGRSGATVFPVIRLGIRISRFLEDTS